jgi:hypothetical protein
LQTTPRVAPSNIRLDPDKLPTRHSAEGRTGVRDGRILLIGAHLRHRFLCGEACQAEFEEAFE